MAVGYITRRVYSAEQLHSLRNTKSQPLLSEAIEEHDQDDAELVKEHVLRGSKSFAARSWRSRVPSGQSLRIPSTKKENRSASASENELQASVGRVASATTIVPILGEIAPNNQAVRSVRGRRSPTSSLKRKKVEEIVKLHGSPTHVRVTAGGRIVPSEQSPLCHPRYGYSAIKSNGGLVKFAPNHPTGKAQWTQATQNGFIAQDINGRLCQIINGTVLPLNEVDGALQLFMPAPNLNITQRGSILGSGRNRACANQESIVPGGRRLVSEEPSTSTQTNALELEYSKLELELKEVDKTEVLHGRTMAKNAKDALVTKRRELVLSLDNVRKALKSIKQKAPFNAPTSPRAMQHNSLMSQPRQRAPIFPNTRHVGTMMPMSNEAQPVFGQYFAPVSAPPYTESYAFQASASPDSAFQGQHWPMQTLVPPPPFDGSMSAVSIPFPASFGGGLPSGQPLPLDENSSMVVKTVDISFTQNDGCASQKCPSQASSPHQSRVMSVKGTENKSSNLKSNLNPMSPAYKPGMGILKAEDQSTATTGRPPTPLSPRRELQPKGKIQSRDTHDTDNTISPTKKSPHVHSSSVSSFETADFFPRNTREYSTRRDAYPMMSDPSEEKENAAPSRHDSKGNESPGVHLIENSGQSSASHKLPPVPPGTPTTDQNPAKSGTQILKISDSLFSSDAHGEVMRDRIQHNASPKTKRQDRLFVQQQPEGPLAAATSSSPNGSHVCIDDTCATLSPYDTVDFSSKPREWIEGYQAGLNRHAVGADRQGQFLDGYCSGLLKSAPKDDASCNGSPAKPIYHRPSPVPFHPRTSADQFQQCSGPNDGRKPLITFEKSLQSFDTLKQAVYDPQNENAILTPAVDSPHVNEMPFQLGAWAKHHSIGMPADVSMTGFQFHTTGTKRHDRDIEEHDGPKGEKSFEPITNMPSGNSKSINQSQKWLSQLPPLPSSPAMSATTVAPNSIFTSNNKRVGSMTSSASSLYRQYPGHRVISPQLEWKAASSVAHHGGLASGYFAHPFVDGTPQAQRPETVSRNPAMHQHSRFQEGSLDGWSNAPLSPASVASPPLSPKGDPAKNRTKDSPNKTGSSPARAKFEHIAEKVGIKVVSTKDQGEAGVSPSKRRWRDVWRASRKDQSKDES